MWEHWDHFTESMTTRRSGFSRPSTRDGEHVHRTCFEHQSTDDVGNDRLNDENEVCNVTLVEGSRNHLYPDSGLDWWLELLSTLDSVLSTRLFRIQISYWNAAREIYQAIRHNRLFCRQPAFLTARRLLRCRFPLEIGWGRALPDSEVALRNTESKITTHELFVWS